MDRLIEYENIKSISSYWNFDGDINIQKSKPDIILSGFDRVTPMLHVGILLLLYL